MDVSALFAKALPLLLGNSPALVVLFVLWVMWREVQGSLTQLRTEQIETRLVVDKLAVIHTQRHKSHGAFLYNPAKKATDEIE